MRKRTRPIPASTTTLVLTILALAALLTIVLPSAPARADQWTDISDQQWEDTYGITAAEAASVADGYPGGTFRPSNPVTRGQFAKMVVDGFDLLPVHLTQPTFSDVPSSHFYFEWVEGAVQAEIVSGYTDGTFRPARNIQRQEANTILGRWLSRQEIAATGHIQGDEGTYGTLSAWYVAEGADVLAPFADDQAVGAAHRAGTAYLVLRGVVKGIPSGIEEYLRPLNNLTRAQAVAMIIRTKEAADFVGAATALVIEDKADGTGAAIGAVSVAAGSTLTAYAVSRDAAGRYVANVAAQWAVTDKTGGVVDADLTPAGDGKRAVFVGGATGTVVITAQAGSLSDSTGVVSVQ